MLVILDHYDVTLGHLGHVLSGLGSVGRVDTDRQTPVRIAGFGQTRERGSTLLLSKYMHTRLDNLLEKILGTKNHAEKAAIRWCHSTHIGSLSCIQNE